MKLKSFFSAFLLAFLFLFASPKTSIYAANTSVICNQIEEDYTYVRTDVDGVIWIYVYDSKGNLVYYYPEE